MNPDIKKEWCERLESGKDTQIQNRLHNKDGFCCLGVLTDIYIQKHPGERWLESENGYYYDGNSILLPSKVSHWAGLSFCPCIDDVSLADLNDQGKTFKEISLLIRENL